MTGRLRVEPDQLRIVAAELPVGPAVAWPTVDGVGLPGDGWASRPTLTAVLTGLRIRLEELAGNAERLASGLRDAAGAYDEADDRAHARAKAARPRARR